jgi:hypothetical protein
VVSGLWHVCFHRCLSAFLGNLLPQSPEFCPEDGDSRLPPNMYRTVWFSGDAVDLYCRDVRFESWPGRRSIWPKFFVAFLGLARCMPGVQQFHSKSLGFLVSWGGVRLSPLGTSATNWPIAPAQDDRWWVWSSRWNENWQGKPKYSEKTCPSDTWSTKNSTKPDLCSNSGRRDGNPATKRLSYFRAS